MNAEQTRLAQARDEKAPWKKWGPYLSERQWGTVREDYSQNGDAWNFFTHDHARSRAYRWGEDGLAGLSDDKQRLCFALALWNGKDPILKERLFGLTNSEGNHGEDVKEYYFYLDSTPTHSYMKYLYKYPQAAFPYANLVDTNRGRSRTEFEYELLDTGVFDHDRYFDVFVEYAKASPEEILIQITVHNRGPESAELHVLPTLWFRNEWAWQGSSDRPTLERVGDAVKVVDVSGYYVTPGLIDIHVHVFAGTGERGSYAGDNSVYPDGFTFRAGVTTVADAGCAGWRNFDDFKQRVIDRARTRVLAYNQTRIAKRHIRRRLGLHVCQIATNGGAVSLENDLRPANKTLRHLVHPKRPGLN
jgi:hypothetical protein